MEDIKKWYNSVGVWAGVLTALTGVLALFGIEVSVADIQVAAESIVAIVAAIGGLIGIYGRVRANKKIA